MGRPERQGFTLPFQTAGLPAVLNNLGCELSDMGSDIEVVEGAPTPLPNGLPACRTLTWENPVTGQDSGVNTDKAKQRQPAGANSVLPVTLQMVMVAQGPRFTSSCLNVCKLAQTGLCPFLLSQPGRP